MQENTKEMWRPIRGYENLYEVSNLGKVRSLDRLVNSKCRSTRLAKGRIVSLSKVRGGYLQVDLWKDNKQTKLRVHRLVASAFPEICGEYVNGLEVDHLDTNPSNNKATNLRWCTHKENSNNPITRRHKSNAQKSEKAYWFGKLGKEHARSIPIVQYDLQGKFLAEWDCACEVERKLGIYQGNISLCCTGKRKTAGGFKWTYKEQ